MYIVPPTKNIPRPPCLVETLKHGRGKQIIDLDLFDIPITCCLGINDKFIPYAVLDPRLVPLFMVKHFVIVLFWPYFLEILSSYNACLQFKQS